MHHITSVRALSQASPKTYVFVVKHTYFDFLGIGPVTGIAEKNLKTYIPLKQYETYIPQWSLTSTSSHLRDAATNLASLHSPDPRNKKYIIQWHRLLLQLYVEEDNSQEETEIGYVTSVLAVS